MASFTHSSGIERGVAIAVEPLQQHQAQTVSSLQAEIVQGGYVALAVDGCLTVQRKAGMHVAIIGTQVEEVLSLSIVATIRCRGEGL